jgi:hypothetical protein
MYLVGLKGQDLDEALLRTFAQVSNGQYFEVGSTADLRQVFRVIRERIETQFSVTYRTTDPVTQNGRRILFVRLRTPFAMVSDECVFNELILPRSRGPSLHTAPR